MGKPRNAASHVASGIKLKTTPHASLYRRYGKRALDLALTIPALIVLFPVLSLIALSVRLALGSPILFRQTRAGLHGKPFTLYKFRTMRDVRDTHGNLLPDGERLSPLGRFLRATSLDELPELWNVLRGDMSLIGPRPLLVQYLPRYTPQQARRHEVRPGITGWAQIHGRNTTPFSKRLDLDVWYVDHACPWLDFRILFLTTVKVLRRDGAIPDQDVSEIDDCGLWVGTDESRCGGKHD